MKKILLAYIKPKENATSQAEHTNQNLPISMLLANAEKDANKI